MRTYADVCGRMLMYAYGSQRCCHSEVEAEKPADRAGAAGGEADADPVVGSNDRSEEAGAAGDAMEQRQL